MKTIACAIVMCTCMALRDKTNDLGGILSLLLISTMSGVGLVYFLINE